MVCGRIYGWLHSCVSLQGNAATHVFSSSRRWHNGLAVHPTESYVLSASWSEGNVKLWDWEKGWECTRIFKFVDFDPVYGVTFLNIKDTDTFAVHGGGGIIKVSVLYHYFIQNFSQSGNIAF